MFCGAAVLLVHGLHSFHFLCAMGTCHISSTKDIISSIGVVYLGFGQVGTSCNDLHSETTWLTLPQRVRMPVGREEHVQDFHVISTFVTAGLFYLRSRSSKALQRVLNWPRCTSKIEYRSLDVTVTSSDMPPES